MNISQLTSLIIILKTCGQIIMVMSNWEKIGFERMRKNFSRTLYFS
jgi:hypothetical protein